MKQPLISRDLLEYLEAYFTQPIPNCSADTPSHIIAARYHQHIGKAAIVDHLRALYETQQEEGDLLQ